MYHIMVIDDNHLSVDGICQNINWSSLDANVDYKIYDGVSALEILKNNSVDLIISDIEMPQMSGLSMAEEILRYNPNIKIILISAFDKFEYARQAVRIGAYDYIEKPIDYEYLTKIIENALKTLEHERKNLEILKRSKPAMIENFFTDLIHSSSDDARYHLASYLDYLNLNLNYRFFQAAVIQVDNAAEIKKKYGVEEYHIRLMELSDMLKESLHTQFGMVYILSRLNGLIILYGHNYSNAKYFQLAAAEIFTQTSDSFQNRLLQFNIGIGTIVKSVWDLPLSYENASKALEYCFFFPQKNIFDIRDTRRKEVPQELFSSQHEEQLIQLLCKKDLNEIRRWIHSFSENLLSSYQTKQLIFIRIYSVLGRILKFLYEMDIDALDIERNIASVYSRLDQFATGSEIFQWLYNICADTCQKLDSSVKSYHEHMCSSVIDYIHSHYGENDLCLGDIAAYVNVSPAHLSALFKKNKSENISDVITSIRIEAACQMLVNTKNSLKEISEKVGYTNQYYFSSCFKKKMGLTPSVYREEHQTN